MKEIPVISDKKLEKLAKKIRPLIRHKEENNSEELYYIDGHAEYQISDLRNRDIYFMASPGKKALDINPRPFKVIKTIHPYEEIPAFRITTLADILAQIPEEDISRTIAFESDYLPSARPDFSESKTQLYEHGGIYAKEDILDISKELLRILMKKIKPVVRFNPDTREPSEGIGELYYIKDVHPRNETFVWDPKPTHRAKDIDSVPYKTITTWHDDSFFFKPSIAEVLAQLPRIDHDKATAFETVFDPSHKTGYWHKAKTMLYKKKH
jgi:hypothetical protein